MRRPALSGHGRGKKMQDVPVECSIDATEVEQMACKPAEPVKPTKPGDDGTVKPLGGGGGTTNPPEPPKKS